MSEDDRTYLEVKQLSLVDPSIVDRYGDPNRHPENQLSAEEVQMLLQAGREMFLTHLTKVGFPMVTVHVYVLIDGEIWSTTINGRVKSRAYLVDPRCGLCISGSGLDLPFAGAMTIKARAEIIEDRDIVKRVCEEHGRRYYSSPEGQRLFTRSLFTPNRVAIRFHVDKVVSWKNIGVIGRE